MDVAQAQRLLNDNGFPCGAVDGDAGPRTKAALERFQRAYAGPDPLLVVDGVLGPKTAGALADLPRLSPHFTTGELRSKGDGTCYVRRELLIALEATRAHIGRAIPVTSAFRDARHNAEVGGARYSQHVLGLAADVGGAGITVDEALAVGVWSGIGDRRGHVLHLDVRHVLSEGNPRGRSPQHPARWYY